MSLFSSILSKLGIGSAEAGTEPGTPATLETPAATPNAIGTVDVLAKLEGLASAHAEPLNWKTSIVDLLKMLGLESSLEARKGLAVELHCPDAAMGDSAAMNVWLQKTVLQQLAQNGGNIPPELLN